MADLSSMPADVQRELRALPGNDTCVDCDTPIPQWASLSYGILMCLKCSGAHRGLGVHISFVRSIAMDSWTERQIATMRVGGNAALNKMFEANGVRKKTPIVNKYNSPVAELYRERILALRDGREPPTELPRAAGGGAGGQQAQLPPADEDPVARQLRLRREAEERLAAKFGAGGMRAQAVSSDGGAFDPNAAGMGGGGGGGGGGPGGAALIDDIAQTSAKAFDVMGSALGRLAVGAQAAASQAAQAVQEQDLGTKLTTGWDTVRTKMADPELSEQARQKLEAAKQTTASGWSMLSSAAGALWGDMRTTFAAEGSGAAADGRPPAAAAAPAPAAAADPVDDWTRQEMERARRELAAAAPAPAPAAAAPVSDGWGDDEDDWGDDDPAAAIEQAVVPPAAPAAPAPAPAPAAPAADAFAAAPAEPAAPEEPKVDGDDFFETFGAQ